MFVLGHRAGLARITKNCFRRLCATRGEAGFTLIEVLIAGLMIVIIGAPLSAILATSSKIGGLARERTAADQFAQTAMETMRTLSYSQVGIVNGNPPGVLVASVAANLPSGEAVTVQTAVNYIADRPRGSPIPRARTTRRSF